MSIYLYILWGLILLYSVGIIIKVIYERVVEDNNNEVLTFDVDENSESYYLNSIELENINNIIILTNEKNNKENCPICYDKMDSGIIKTECDHIFHKQCIITWLSSEQKQRFKCPICIQNLSLDT